MAKPLGLSIDIEDNVAELSRNPVVTKNGTLYLGQLIVSSGGVTSSDGASTQLNPEDLTAMSNSLAGKGSSGSVRRMKHTKTGMILAVKEIKINSEHHFLEIQRELETLNGSENTSHPNLIQFYGAYSHEGSVYIAMECMDGSLQDFVECGVPEPILSRITRMVLNGLWYLHKQRHMIHRDIKPSNLLYDLSGRIKITDFGVSSQLEATKANANSFVGTVTYMSPERLKGERHGTSSDVWSVGVSVVELALGKHPYHALLSSGPSGSEAKFWTILQHLNSGNRSVELPAAFCPEFHDFIAKCCDKNADTRGHPHDLQSHPWILKHKLGSDAEDEQSIREWFASSKPPAAKADAEPAKPAAGGGGGGAALEALLDNLVDVG